MLQPEKYQIEIVTFFILILSFFFLRLYKLESLPIFVDESIYIRWAQVAKDNAGERFISLKDGKQPSFIWLTELSMRFIKDPLMAGRTVSVVAGFLGMVGIFFLATELFNNMRVGLLSAGLYMFYPFALVYDRLALYESLLGMFFVWSIYCSILLVRKIRLDIALLLAMIIGGGLLTKTSAFFSMYLLPVSLILFDWRKKQRYVRLVRWCILAVVSVIIAYGYYSVLRLSPYFRIIDEKNGIFIRHIQDLIPSKAFYAWSGHERLLLQWLIEYATWPIFLFTIASFFLFRENKKEKLFLFLYFFIPFILLGLFGKILYPRFIFFMTLPLLPIAATALNEAGEIVRNKVVYGILFLCIISFMLRSNFYILYDFARAPIPVADLEQLINGWPAGGGIMEFIDFLKKESEKNDLYVVTDAYGSLPSNAIDLYMNGNKHIEKVGIHPTKRKIPKKIMEKAQYKKTYLIFDRMEVPTDWPISLITRYKKGLGKSYMSVYTISVKDPHYCDIRYAMDKKTILQKNCYQDNNTGGIVEQ